MKISISQLTHYIYNNVELQPNDLVTVYEGPNGLTYARGSMEFRDDDHMKVLVFRTMDFVPSTWKELRASIEFQFRQQGNNPSPARALSLICLLFLGAAFASCGHQEQLRLSEDLNIPRTSISATAEDLAAGQWRIDSAGLKGGHTHFYYRKGDSTRHIITYNGRIVSDKRK